MDFNVEHERINEEFNNFMHKVNDVTNIVSKLSSKDKRVQEIGVLEADRYLNTKTSDEFENLCGETVKLTVKTNRAVINKEALMKDESDQDTMSQEAFMKEVSRDADRRYKDRKIRQEKADTLKTQAAKAFRRGEYEKALSLYNKAIEHIKDSCMLYTNRSLAQMHLHRYENAIEDAERALYFNENSLKARLLLAKYHLLNGSPKMFRRAIEEAKQRHKDQTSYIDEFFIEQLKAKEESDAQSVK